MNDLHNPVGATAQDKALRHPNHRQEQSQEIGHADQAQTPARNCRLGQPKEPDERDEPDPSAGRIGATRLL